MTKNKPMNTMLSESSPVTGSDWAFSSVGIVVGASALGATVVVVGATVVVVGVPAKMFDATESPIALTALMVTEYAVPFVSPEMVNGLEVDAGFNAEYVTPSVEYL
jgi:hypothetical protein